MAQPQLEELYEWLKRSDANRFEIYNVETGKSIEKCVSYEDLTAGGSTPEEYFTRLLSKGVKTVQLQKKRKNGSSWIREGCGLNYGLSTEDNVAASGQVRVSEPATPQQYQYPSGNGLGSPASSFGLGFPEIMSMRSQADRYQETKEECKDLKAKVELLERENRVLETENLQYKFGADSKPSAVDKLVEGLASNPAALASMIQSFKGAPANPGLNAPVTPKLSDTKEMVIDTISNQHVSDDHVAAAYYVLVQAAQKNEKFMDKYHQLLTDFNLIQHGSDSDSDSI